MEERQVYLNGEFVPESEAKVHVFDSAILYGDMVFETSRTFKHKPYRLDEHLERMYRSLKVTGIDPGMSMEEMEEITLETVNRNLPLLPPEDDYQIVHNVSRGIFPLYREEGKSYPSATISIHCWPASRALSKIAKYYDSGVHCVTAANRAVPPQCLDPKVKNRSRLYYTLAQLSAERVDPEAFCVLLDLDGHLAESIGSNIFLVTKGHLYTPEGRNILRGVTRGLIMEIALELEIPCQESNLNEYDLYTADEAFLTSTVLCLLPVTRFNNVPVGSGVPGPISKRLLTTWSQKVGVNIVEQARRSAAVLNKTLA